MELKDIRKIIELMKSNELTEFELAEDQFRISIKRGGEPVYMQPAAVPHPATVPAADALAATAPGADETVANDEDAGLLDIVAPIVGSVYYAPSPDAEPFVQVGDAVDENTIVCIVEAMKVMNEIKADVKGTIEKVLIDNGSPVEYGQAIFKVKPH